MAKEFFIKDVLEANTKAGVIQVDCIANTTRDHHETRRKRYTMMLRVIAVVTVIMVHKFAAAAAVIDFITASKPVPSQHPKTPTRTTAFNVPISTL